MLWLYIILLVCLSSRIIYDWHISKFKGIAAVVSLPRNDTD